ncbi:MAG: gamma-glutamylcyclotransferase [Nevskiales bacterium]|nr:gamma-glutamylcyclotransferase [Nevskiales bacterium]
MPPPRSEPTVPLFVYGSLLSPQVRRIVVGNHPPAAIATLRGFRRVSLHGHTFPGLVPAATVRTRGLLIDVSAAQLRRLDRYESDYYRRLPVTVSGADGARRRAEVYVLSPAYRRLCRPAPWRPRAYEQRHAARGARSARADLAAIRIRR